MKLRQLSAAFAALLVSLSAVAVPAWTEPFDYIQPDGSVIRLQRHGDEFFSWTTLAGSSQVMELDAEGFWRYSTLDPVQQEKAHRRREEANQFRRNQVMAAAGNGFSMTRGERHIPVLLVAFKDVDFKLDEPNKRFSDMLNQNGYSASGATGSVQDYYLDNSHDVFKPVFDVYGPVKLKKDESYYGAHEGSAADVRPEMALYDAAVALNSQIDFSQYDYDNDGMVDMVLFYYAGYSEAEGGPTTAIWPHQWDLRGSSEPDVRNNRFDGKRIGPYFCTAELRGSGGSNMCGIGPTCHEFGHSLGLPDFYDSDYGTNGYAGGLYEFSLMCAGSYNNNSRTPPYLNAVERTLLGWLDAEDVPILPRGTQSFGSVKDDIAFFSETNTEGEYFLYECRDGSGWDKPIPAGLVIYHVDQSTSHRVGGMTAYDQWAYWKWSNSINAYGSHPCFYVIPADNPKSLNYSGSLKNMVFPGGKNVTKYTPVDWSKKGIGVELYDISYADGQVKLSVRYEGIPDDPEPEPEITCFGQLGMNAIEDPGMGSYAAGAEFPLALDLPDDREMPSSVHWLYDGTAVDGASVTLSAGAHTVTAILGWEDGAEEKLELLLDVK